MDLHDYDKYIVSFSGGKDSTALLLYLLDNDVPKERIELWHQEIDGRCRTLFDWEVTPDYCRKLGEAFGIPVYFQWKEGGFEREMLRKDSLTAPVCYELPDRSIIKIGGTRGKPSTRRRFPQPSPDLRTRWCSAYLKIDVCATALRHDERFQNIRTLVLSGERGELILTKNEMLIFRTLLERQGKIVSRDELMTVLWDNAEYINDNALTVNISRLRTKLSDFGCDNAIETRKKQGYILI